MTFEKRIDMALDRIEQIGAKAKRIVLNETDLPEMHGQAERRSVPIAKGAVGGRSFIEAEGAPSGDNTDFAI